MRATVRGGPPQSKVPASQRPAPSTSPNVETQSSRCHGRADGYAAPDAVERHEARVLAQAAELGYRLSVACLDCHRPLTDVVSVAYRRGPTCRARAEATL